MNDINPNFVPRALKRPAPVSLDSSRKEKGKGKEKATPAKDGILSFFGLFLSHQDNGIAKLTHFQVQPQQYLPGKIGTSHPRYA